MATCVTVSRKYDASRRAEMAQKTRDAILAAAFRLHGQGILDMESLAREANVSVATVRKHFPTRKLVFEGCTAFGMQHLVSMPEFEALAAIEGSEDRTRETVRQVYALHEALLGQAWVGFKLEDESPAMVNVLRQIEGIVGAASEIVAAAWPARAGGDAAFRGLVSGMLSPLTFRALRVQSGLSPQDATDQVSEVLVRAGQAAAESNQGATAHR